MALIHRFSRLLSADLHAVMDRLEDPQVLLQQAQREMTAAIANERALLARTERALTRCTTQLERATSALEALQQELDLCFEAEDEALARSVIKRRLQCSAEQLALQDQQRDLTAQQAELTERIHCHQSDLETIAAEAERLAEQSEFNTSATATLRTAEAGNISDEAIELALLAERRARTNAQGVRS